MKKGSDVFRLEEFFEEINDRNEMLFRRFVTTDPLHPLADLPEDFAFVVASIFKKKLAINIVLPCLPSWLAESSGYYEFGISDSATVRFKLSEVTKKGAMYFVWKNFLKKLTIVMECFLGVLPPPIHYIR